MKGTERELTEWAAKAAGLTGEWSQTMDGAICLIVEDDGASYLPWQPLHDDGDAFRLAVKLRMDICRPHDEHDAVCVWDIVGADFIEEPHGTDPCAATRRAIVCAAAQIGRSQHGG